MKKQVSYVTETLKDSINSKIKVDHRLKELVQEI